MDDEGGAPAVPDGGPPLYAVSDLHGHHTRVRAALTEAGLTDGDGRWTGGEAVLWVLGDLMDRGPDGVGVLDLVRALERQAADHGGAVHALLGNHDVLALAVHRFGPAPVASAAGRPNSFTLAWLVNGGHAEDQARLTVEHVDWLSGLPVLGRERGWLLAHSDTTSYLDYGRTVEEVNDAVAEVVAGDDLEQWWELFRRLTSRHDYLGPDGPRAAAHLLGTLGAERLVHGHSILATLTGTPSEEVTGPLRYADGLVLAIDGGMYDGGPCLLTRLDRLPRP
ncbi:MAG TPA: metallophosphoesterase [Segeticoccus sp.]|nr:metallophosphoesterase [Segeticoccus sp.]